MTEETNPLRPPTHKELQAILDQATKHPSEQQKLANAPEDVLKQAGLIATTDAVEFIRSFGQTKFEDSAQPAKPAENDPAGGGMAEF